MAPFVLKDPVLHGYIAKPVVEFLGECDWKLVKTYRLNGYTVPKGFRFDGASIPRPLWWWNDPAGVSFPAAIVHDYHYTHQTVERKQADDAFFRNLVSIGVRPTAAWLMWVAVRLFGGRAWRKHRSEAEARKNRLIGDD